MVAGVYCGVNKVPKKSVRGTMKDCAEAGQIRYYGIKKIDEKLIDYVKSSKKAASTTNSIKIEIVRIKGKINAVKRAFDAEKNQAKKLKINEEYKKLVADLKKAGTKLSVAEKKRSLKRSSSKKSNKKKSSKKK